MNILRDLAFLVPEGWKEEDEAPKKFVVFFDNIREAVLAEMFLRQWLTPRYRQKIWWIHFNMLLKYKVVMVEGLKSGEIWDVCTTDSFGIVSQSLCLYMEKKLLKNRSSGYRLTRHSFCCLVAALV